MVLLVLQWHGCATSVPVLSGAGGSAAASTSQESRAFFSPLLFPLPSGLPAGIPAAGGPMLTPLEQAVQAVFSSEGVLLQGTEQFIPRQAQTDMALAVAQAIVAGQEGGHVLVAEAVPAWAKPSPTSCQRCSAVSASCSPPPPRPCRTSCSGATCPGWLLRWGCRCRWRCSRGAAATCACTGWNWPATTGWRPIAPWPMHWRGWSAGRIPPAAGILRKCPAWMNVQR